METRRVPRFLPGPRTTSDFTGGLKPFASDGVMSARIGYRPSPVIGSRSPALGTRIVTGTLPDWATACSDFPAAPVDRMGSGDFFLGPNGVAISRSIFVIAPECQL